MSGVLPILDKIKKIETVKKLQSLELLNFTNNKIKDISSIEKLVNLDVLYIRKNNLDLFKNKKNFRIIREVNNRSVKVYY